jgi:hypothetical protein
VDSLQDADLLAYAHAEEGMVCQDCHEAAVLEEVHEGTTDPNVTQLTERVFPNEFCFDCHLPNEHTSYEEIIERTKDYMHEDQQINPHDPHAGTTMEEEQFDCDLCHKMHKETEGININYCYSCHHALTLENCNVCHEEN